ncbi:MAG: hypothetical protein AAF562_01080 [Pseudomonadota bacterium]
MTPEDLARVRRALPPLPHGFAYGPEDYALHLLKRQLSQSATVRQLKASALYALLQKAQTAIKGGGQVDQTDCAQALANRPKYVFPVTVRAWGNNPGPNYDRYYYQTARQGFNLVIQMGLPSEVWRDFRALCKPYLRDPYNSDSHPARKSGPPTLAWARIDLDWTTREALIEEVQSDWAASIQEDRRDSWVSSYDFGNQPDRVLTFLKHVFPAVETLWPEAILWLTIDMLTQHLKMQRVYMYDHQTGNLTKGYRGRSVGPRSLYEKLPKSFCMVKEEGPPAFLSKDFKAGDLAKRFKDIRPMFWRLPKRGELLLR